MRKREDYNIRPIEEKDIEIVLRWRNSERVRAVSVTDHIISESEHRKWFEKNKLCEDATTLIFELSNTPIGLINFSQIDRNNFECFWGFYLGEEGSSRGIGTIMGFIALNYAFNELGMRTIKGEIFGFNRPGIAFHEKIGFTEQKEEIKWVLKRDIYQDLHIFVLTIERWCDVRPKIEEEIF
jgi:UDP-4-amino-4,6-dideoxy-N-acetyl-beta-L-altrosamine N-acetyltransferase